MLLHVTWRSNVWRSSNNLLTFFDGSDDGVWHVAYVTSWIPGLPPFSGVVDDLEELASEDGQLLVVARCSWVDDTCHTGTSPNLKLNETNTTCKKSLGHNNLFPITRLCYNSVDIFLNWDNVNSKCCWCNLKHKSSHSFSTKMLKKTIILLGQVLQLQAVDGLLNIAYQIACPIVDKERQFFIIWWISVVIFTVLLLQNPLRKNTWDRSNKLITTARVFFKNHCNWNVVLDGSNSIIVEQSQRIIPEHYMIVIKEYLIFSIICVFTLQLSLHTTVHSHSHT